jgi:hypothetical protein
MSDPSPFKSRHFEAEIILCAVRWYLRYALSYRDVEELCTTAVCLSIIPRSFVGSNAMPPNWSNGAGRG